MKKTLASSSSKNEEKEKNYTKKFSECQPSRSLAQEPEDKVSDSETREARSESFKYDHISQFSYNFIQTKQSKLEKNEETKKTASKHTRKKINLKDDSNSYSIFSK